MKQRIKATTAADCHAKTAGRVLFSFLVRFSRKSAFHKKNKKPRRVYAGGPCFLARCGFFSRGSRFFREAVEIFSRAVEMFLEALKTPLMDSFFQDLQMFT